MAEPREVVIPGLQPAAPVSVYRGGPTGDVSLASLGPPEPQKEKKPKPQEAKAVTRVSAKDMMRGKAPGTYGEVPQGPPPEQLASDLEQAAQRVGPLGAQDVIAGQMTGLQGAYADLERQRAAMRPYVSRTPNAAYPIAQEQYADQRGRGEGALDFPAFQPEPYEPLPRFEGETDEQWQARNQLFADADLRLQKEVYDRQRAEALAQAGQLGPDTDLRDLGGVMGFEEAGRQAQEQYDAEVLQAEEAGADAAQQLAQQQADATAQAAQQMEEQRQREEEGLRAVEHVRAVRDQARQSLAQLPEIDREKVAKGLSTGTKIAAVMGAIAQGWRGDAITAVNDAIDRGVEDVVRKYSRREAEYQGVVDQADSELAFFGNLVATMGGNVRAAAQMFRQFRMEDAEAEFNAQLAKASVPETRAMLQQAAVTLEQQRRQETDAFEIQANTTPREFVKVIDPYRSQRKEIKEQQKELRDEMRGLRESFVGATEKSTDRDLKREEMAVDAEERRTKALRGEGGVYRESADLADRIAPKQALVKGIADLKRDFSDGIPGVGAFAGTETAAAWAEGLIEGKPSRAREFDMRLRNILRAGLRDESGAVLSDEEIDQQIDLLMSGATDINGEAKVWQNLDAYADRLNREIDVMARGRSKEAQQYLSGNMALPDRDPTGLGQAPSREVVRRK